MYSNPLIHRNYFRTITAESCQNEPDTSELLDTPEILQNVQSARVAELRLESLMKLGKQLLADLPGYEQVGQKLAKALDEVEKQRQELTESWVKILLVIYVMCTICFIACNSTFALCFVDKSFEKRSFRALQ